MTQASPEERPEQHLTIRVNGSPEDLFDLVRFRGRETLSAIPAFELELTATTADIAAASLLNVPAVVEVRMPGGSRRFRGILSSFEYLTTNPHTSSYRTTLTPRLSWLAAVRQSRVFLDKTVPEIVVEVLADYGLERGEDYQFRLRPEYSPQEYTVQYEETDLAFISRLLEHRGIYYYFEPDLDRDFVVFADHIEAHTPVRGGGDLIFRAGRPTSPAGPAVSELAVRQVSPPREVLLKDYNYRKPTVDQRGLAKQSDSSVPALGRFMEYGAHFKTPEEGERLAAIRLEELSCTGSVLSGLSGYPVLAPGLCFSLADHPKTDCNGEFLLVEVDHDIRQPGVPGEASALLDEEAYRNTFRAIPRTTQFRPARVTVKPKILGTLHATIDAAGTGEYAEIDEHGRYKVRLPFDLAGRDGGKASRFIRMAQPYAGPDYGSHFPLHKGTEVLLTHIDGDPDRPIISAAIPNPATASPVRNKNQTQSVVKTAANNQLVLEDVAGGVNSLCSSPKRLTRASTSAPHMKECRVSPYAHPIPNRRILARTVRQPIGGSRSINVDGNSTTTIQGSLTEHVGTTMQTTVGQSLTISAGTAITLKCGASTIHMTEAGTISISGSLVSISGTYSANVVAPITNIVGALMVTVTGALSLVTGTISRLTGASKATVSGNTVDVVAKGDASVTGSTVKLN